MSFKTERRNCMTGHTKPWKARLAESLPNRDTLSVHPWLQPVASRLLQPQLWRFQHEAVARGVAVGTFWAFVMPIAQMVAAAAHCTVWRANIPVAAAMTMVAANTARADSAAFVGVGVREDMPRSLPN